MTTSTHTLGDSATMLRRDLKHMIRYPSVTVMLIGMPVVLLLLFVDVLGGTLGDRSLSFVQVCRALFCVALCLRELRGARLNVDKSRLVPGDGCVQFGAFVVNAASQFFCAGQALVKGRLLVV